MKPEISAALKAGEAQLAMPRLVLTLFVYGYFTVALILAWRFCGWAGLLYTWATVHAAYMASKLCTMETVFCQAKMLIETLDEVL